MTKELNFLNLIPDVQIKVFCSINNWKATLQEQDENITILCMEGWEAFQASSLTIIVMASKLNKDSGNQNFEGGQ